MPSRLWPICWLTALALLGCAFVASCSGSSRSPTSAASTTATITPLTDAQRLDAQMLTLDDLPHGWSVDRRTSVPGASCGLSFFGDPRDGLERDRQFDANTSGLPALGESLVSFPSVSAAKQFYAGSIGSGGCVSDSVSPAAPVSSSSYSAPVYSFLTASDESQADRESNTTTMANGASLTVADDRLVARRGRVIALVYLAAPHDPDSHWQLFAQLATQAVDKITARETTVGYVRANRLCRAGLSRTLGATTVTYAGVTTPFDLLGTAISLSPVLASEPTNAFLAVCSYSGPRHPLIQVYIDAAGHRSAASSSS